MKSRVWNFETDTPDALPAGFTKELGEWKVAADETAPSKRHVLAQAAKSPKPDYNVVLVDSVQAKNLDLSVHLKPIAGTIDQGGGVVWRAKDAKNYYICRYNPLENNFRVYKVVDGRRTELASADIQKTDGWQTLRITMREEQIECFLDGKKHLEVNDGTFGVAGRIGLWTKADAQTHFDDLTLKPKDE